MMRSAVASLAILCLRAAAQEAAPCTLGGTVVDSFSDKPVVRARVIAETEGYSLVRLTDARGSFCFENLTPGDYDLMAQKAGYGDALHTVTLAVEENAVVKPLLIRMTRYAGLSGTVLDTEGELLPGVQVTVWQRVRSQNGAGPLAVDVTRADSRGAFRVSRLDPGTYYLSVNPENKLETRFVLPFVDNHGQMPREKEVETFYSAAFTLAGATPLELKPGQQLDSLVLTLRKARLRRVTGRIANPPREGFLSFEGETGAGSDRSGAIPIASDGSFVRADLPPGKYTFRLYDGRKPIARQDIDLTDGDAVGITLDPIETADIPVTFRTEGKGPPFRPRAPGPYWGASMLVRDGSGEAVGLEPAGGGTYRFPGVERGIYRLRMELAGQQLYLKGVTYGGETQTGDKLDLRSLRPGGLEITFSSNVAEVQGLATAPEDESGGLTVILVDEANDGEPARIAGATGTDQKGRFRLPGVAPGKYRLFAIEGFDDEEWGSPELAKVLQAKAVELQLKESDKRQVSVTAITAGEWAAAVKKTGG